MAVRLIEIEGGPRERGRAYGEAARTEIRASVAYYRKAFRLSSKLEWTDVQASARRWREPVAAVAPDLLTEMDAIAEGAGLHPDEILALNARGEIVRNHDSGFNPEPAEGCSSFALLPEATGDGHVYCGQNWDWREGTQETVVLLRVVQPPKPTLIMQVEAGQIGRHGANSAGLALNANGLDGRFGAPLGLPQPVLRRLILDQDRLRRALQMPFDVHQHIATSKPPRFPTAGAARKPAFWSTATTICTACPKRSPRTTGCPRPTRSTASRSSSVAWRRPAKPRIPPRCARSSPP
jgi:isopenicillin-N N-acyltransferase like protein